MKLDYKVLETFLKNHVTGGEQVTLLQKEIVSGTKDILKKYGMLNDELRRVISDYKNEDMYTPTLHSNFVDSIIQIIKQF